MARSRWRIERLTTFARPLREPLPEQRLGDYELVEPTVADLDAFHDQEPKDFPAGKRDGLAARLGTDEHVWLVRDAAGRWVGWCHLVRGRGPNSRINHTLRLAPDEVYLFDDGTIRSRRRQGVHAFTVAQRLALARDAGATRAVTTITNRNRGSIRSYRKLGFRPRSQLLHLPAARRSLQFPLTPDWVRRVAGAGRGRRHG